MPSDIIIRPYQPGDRPAVRRIACETAFRDDAPRQAILYDDEILADALTRYFTDYEPGSCFVEESCGQVKGYLTGTLDCRAMEQTTFTKIIPALLARAFWRGVFFRISALRFFLNVAGSFLKGEFRSPDFEADYPAMLHINIDKNFRGAGLGTRLITRFIAFLQEKKSKGVHFGTLSERAAKFFAANGFVKLHTSRRSYLRYYLKKDLPYYVFGMKL